MNLTPCIISGYGCRVAGTPATEFCSSCKLDGRKPILNGVVFFVSVIQLVGRMLRGFKPAVFLDSRSANLIFGSPFLFCSENSEYSKSRGAAMHAQTQGNSAHFLTIEISCIMFCALVRAEVAILHELDVCSDKAESASKAQQLEDIQATIDWVIKSHLKAVSQ